MKTIKLVAPIMGALVMAMAATTASAAPGLRLDKPDISVTQCKPKGISTQLLVDVHFKTLNVADSGFGASGSLAWANDTIDRHLRIYQRNQDGFFCVSVEDHGKFVTYAGDGPGDGDTPLAAGIRGDIEGGYTSNFFAATFVPTLATRGNLGTFDLACEQNLSIDCPGSRPNYLSYLSNVVGANITQEWGWIYRAGKHGTWLNQDDVDAAHSGNIQ